jgi:hypothetical protein
MVESEEVYVYVGGATQLGQCPYALVYVFRGIQESKE